MDPLNALYDEIAAGSGTPPADYNLYKRMLARARGTVRHGTPEEQLAGVTVCGAIGGNRGMDVVRTFLKGPPPEVRRRAVEVAVDNGEDGLMVLREASLDPDPEVALEALRWLRRALDPGATTQCRRLLRSDDDAVRAAAIELLGCIAGQGVAVQLRRLLTDSNPAIVEAATLAIARLGGSEERPTPEPWWDEPEVVAYAPPEILPLPDELPDDPKDLLRLLGRLSHDDQPSVLPRLEEIGSRDLGYVVRALAPDTDRELCMGGAVATRLLELGSWVVPIRRLLQDADPSVRIAVAETLGVVGKSSVVMGLTDLLSDPLPQVRLAGVSALGKLLPAAQLRRILKPVVDDPDPEVHAAVQALLMESLETR